MYILHYCEIRPLRIQAPRPLAFLYHAVFDVRPDIRVAFVDAGLENDMRYSACSGRDGVTDVRREVERHC